MFFGRLGFLALTLLSCLALAGENREEGNSLSENGHKSHLVWIEGSVQIAGGAYLGGWSTKLEKRLDRLESAAQRLQSFRATQSTQELLKRADDLDEAAFKLSQGRGNGKEVAELQSRAAALKQEVDKGSTFFRALERDPIVKNQSSNYHITDDALKKDSVKIAESKFKNEMKLLEEEIQVAKGYQIGKGGSVIKVFRNGLAFLLVFNGSRQLIDYFSVHAEPKAVEEVAVPHRKTERTH